MPEGPADGRSGGETVKLQDLKDDLDGPDTIAPCSSCRAQVVARRVADLFEECDCDGTCRADEPPHGPNEHQLCLRCCYGYRLTAKGREATLSEGDNEAELEACYLAGFLFGGDSG